MRYEVLDVGEVDVGVDIAANWAFLVHFQPSVDAVQVELVLAPQLQVHLGGLSLHQADRAVELALAQLGLHAVFEPHRIQDQSWLRSRLHANYPLFDHSQDLPLSATLLADYFSHCLLALQQFPFWCLLPWVHLLASLHPMLPPILVLLCTFEKLGLHSLLKPSLSVAGHALEGVLALQLIGKAPHFWADTAGHVCSHVGVVAVSAENPALSELN
jgi:hypothetical protein